MQKPQRKTQKPGADFSLATGSQIAALFKVSPSAVSGWVRKHGCPRRDDGLYDVAAVIAWKTERDTALVGGDSDALERWRAARAEAEELRVRRLKNELVEVQAVRDEVTRLCTVVREHARELTDDIARELGVTGDQIKVLDDARRRYLDRCATDMESHYTKGKVLI
ncbi:MAG TPA: hypothetical protein PKI05_08205 [Thermogutta sp.]|nr:hypothetical protein [Thermogutta sp.]